MNTFLKYVANDIYEKAKGNFQDTTIVFPNKRATLFFNKFLWEKAEGNTIWTPEYTSVSELFSSLSDYTIADPVYLICQLYKTYIKFYKDTDKSFDELYPFLEMMLADFQDVDNNLVPADKIFRNISELQEMTDYDFLEKSQIEAISHFFNDLKWEERTMAQTRFASLWNNLHEIYTDFQKDLLDKDDPIIYEGMLKRLAIEPALADTADGCIAAQKLTSRLSSTTYVFVGFNVLNKAERELFKFIKKNKQTFFYWDYDITYCSGSPIKTTSNQHGFEAGMFILENIRDFGSAIDASSELYKNFCHPKKITLIQSPTENAQARYINQWTKENVKQGDTLNDSAIILCNENLLQPVLHSIPAKLTDENGKDTDETPALNVTMGYPISATPAFTLIQALLELQLKGRTRSGAWRYKQTSAILKHPYVRRMTQNEANNTLTQLTENHIIFPTDEAFAGNEVLSTIFTEKKGKELTHYLTNILTLAAQGIEFSNDKNDFDTQLYKESIFTSYTVINRLHNLQEKMPEIATLHDGTIARIISQMLQRSTIPFHGEPASGLQVMGFLETRNLDFKNVIMLSAGEGQMPKANKRPSLIPYTLQVAFGMTTIDKEVSIYAYYFYRILQRAENITILWNSSVEEGNKGEMSRFVLQIMVEAEKILAPNQHIDLQTIITSSESISATSLSVQKTDEIVQKLHRRFDIATEDSEEFKKKHSKDGYQLLLSPSAILCYLKCPMQFFFKYVASLRPDDDLSEDIDDAVFGDIFHYAMEQIYKPFADSKQPTKSTDILAIANNHAKIKLLVEEGFQAKLFKIAKENKEQKLSIQQINYSGAQLIKQHVLRKLIKIQLEADADTAQQAESKGGYFAVLGIEEKHSVVREIKPDNSHPFKVRIGGIIDRIDMIDNGLTKTIRIVDYKTSAKIHTASDVADLFDPKKTNANYHITQTLYYCDVLTEDGAYGADRIPVVPAIMYYKNNKKKENAVVKLNYPGMEKDGRKKPYILDYVVNCKSDFEPLMKHAIERIFEPGEFTQCLDDHTCKYCDFKLLCRRNPKDNF